MTKTAQEKRKRLSGKLIYMIRVVTSNNEKRENKKKWVVLTISFQDEERRQVRIEKVFESNLSWMTQ